MSTDNYDIVIIGGGPSGLTAAIYTTRRSLKTLVISKDIGGQLSLTDDVENYPGFESIGGMDLSVKFQQQAAKTGTEFLFEEVVSLEKKENGDTKFSVKTASGKEINAKAVILGFGLTPRNLGVPGEIELTGKGVTYCATCDGPLYRGKVVVVVGGGNSALDAAEYMSKLAKKVYMLVRKDKFRGEQILAKKVHDAENIEVVFQVNAKEIKGTDKVESLVYATDDGKETEIDVDGVFIEIGHIAKTDWLKDVVDRTERGEIKISIDNETNQPGIFAAGDVTEITYKQAVISAGEGCKAALQAYRYIQGDQPLIPDWTPKKK
ncbi:FAD-dependent oxidoreductase [Candidatus Parcubacteria bacterium]|jgi:thioredoxin reductase (NADPH)|nr:FAD-dependent oxidoreductase [Candidatus Parcubacteria bacterium]MBT7228162.1 FAD-dependent oxidoreductase [Candidatus Parcubacteria bacterium]